MTSEQAIKEIQGRIDHWSGTHTPNSVKPYLKALEKAVLAIKIVDQIVDILNDVYTNLTPGEEVPEPIEKITDAIHGCYS